MRKQTFIFVLFFLLSWGGNAFAQGRIEPTFRAGMPDITRKMCFSVLSFPVDRPANTSELEYRKAAAEKRLESKDSDSYAQEEKSILAQYEAEPQPTASEYFHHTVNCLLNDAYGMATNGINKEVKAEFESYTGHRDLLLEDITPEVEDCSVSMRELQRKQEKIRTSLGLPETQCDTDGKYPTMEQPYSACRVGEALLAEWCGYKTYLWSKQLDDLTLIETDTEDRVGYGQAEVSQSQSDDLKAEMEKTETALSEALKLYRNFEQNYRIHAWLTAIKSNWQTANAKIFSFRKAINLFPEKFVNAASKTCKQ